MSTDSNIWIRRILLVTDFGAGVYVGQMRAALDALLPATPVIDLVHDLPAFRPDLAAYLLPAMIRDMPGDSLYLCVVDPGVGGARAGLVVCADGVWLIAPDNGLVSQVISRARDVAVWRIGWQPPMLSASFHGRDWFVPVAGRLCHGDDLGLIGLTEGCWVGSDWPLDSARILYIDHFGNLITGLQPPDSPTERLLEVGDCTLTHARTFCAVDAHTPFWYVNALGLVEVAVNQGRADHLFHLVPGDPVGPFAG